MTACETGSNGTNPNQEGSRHGESNGIARCGRLYVVNWWCAASVAARRPTPDARGFGNSAALRWSWTSFYNHSGRVLDAIGHGMAVGSNGDHDCLFTIHRGRVTPGLSPPLLAQPMDDTFSVCTLHVPARFRID